MSVSCARPRYPGAEALLCILNIRPGETVLVLSDGETPQKPLAILENIIALHGAHPSIDLSLPSTFQEELPPRFEPLIREADVILFAASHSFYHTQARKKAKHQWHKRVAECYGITEATLVDGGLTADYREVARRGRSLAAAFSTARAIRVTSREGTDLSCRIKKVGYETGLYRRPGTGGNLPAGEVFIVPEPGTAHGHVVFDLSMDSVGRFQDRSPLRIVIDKGRITGVFGHNASLLEDAIARNETIRHVAELAFGTNTWAKTGRTVLEDEKSCGTAHVGFGNDTYFGGNTGGPHLDGVFLEPTALLDDTEEILSPPRQPPPL